MDSRQFVEGMSHAACTVSVVTTDGSAGRSGVTVSAMTSVSAEPPTLLVCVHHLSPACDRLKANGVLCVNVLGEDQQTISDTFAGRMAPSGADKFDCAIWTVRATGAPNLVGALITFDCRVTDNFQVGTHVIFIAEPMEIHIREEGKALVYANRAYGATRELKKFIGERRSQSEADALRIACFTTLGPFFIPRLVGTFLELEPETRFEFFEGSEEEIEQTHEESPFDVILMYDSQGDFDGPSEIVASVSPYVLLPAGHTLSEQSAVSLRELASHPMVLLDIKPSRDYFTGLFASHDLHPDIRFRSPSFETVRGMVANGLGYSLLVSRPASTMSYDGNALVARPVKETVTPGQLVLRIPAGQESSALTQRFADHSREFFTHWGI